MKNEYILDLITPIIGSRSIAEDVLNVLLAEDLLKNTYGDADVTKIVETFKMTFGTTKATKFDRFAASRLAKKHGTDAVVQVLRMIAARSDEKYCPTIGSVSQLEEKWVSAIRFLREGLVKEVEL